jgi:sulfofructose kinase
MSGPRWDMLGFGAVAIDDLLYVDHYPGPDSKVRVQDEQRHGGGLTGTALVAAARLGAHPAFCGVMDDSELAQWSIAELEREGVDCSPVLHRAGAGPIHSRIIIDRSTAQRVIFFNTARVSERKPEEFDAGLIGATRVLFVDNTVMRGAIRASEIARSLGVPVAGDIERGRGPGLDELLPLIDHLILGEQLGRELTGNADPAAMVKALAAPWRACCVVTASERGAWFSEHGGPLRHQPAFPVKAVDTNGCGDVFHGAYVACLTQGNDVPACVRIASATAAIKATHPGGRAGIPNRALVDRFLEERSHE